MYGCKETHPGRSTSLDFLVRSTFPPWKNHQTDLEHCTHPWRSTSVDSLVRSTSPPWRESPNRSWALIITKKQHSMSEYQSSCHGQRFIWRDYGPLLSPPSMAGYKAGISKKGYSSKEAINLFCTWLYFIFWRVEGGGGCESGPNVDRTLSLRCSVEH